MVELIAIFFFVWKPKTEPLQSRIKSAWNGSVFLFQRLIKEIYFFVFLKISLK